LAWRSVKAFGRGGKGGKDGFDMALIYHAGTRPDLRARLQGALL